LQIAFDKRLTRVNKLADIIHQWPHSTTGLAEAMLQNRLALGRISEKNCFGYGRA
jgi:hypothetical protein